MTEASQARAAGSLARGPSLPGWAARGLAGLLFAGALGLPWLATWQGVLQRPAPEVPAPEVVQYRPELVLVPGGRFRMGSSQAERERVAKTLPEDQKKLLDDEHVHDAEVGPLYACQTEVTLGQWKAVVGTSPNDCQYGCEDRHPVANVSWSDACRFMIELTRRENEVLRLRGAPELTPCYTEEGEGCAWTNRTCTGFRLPTETEWEYLARAGTTTAYFFGDDPAEFCKYGNGADQAAKREHPDWTVLDCDDGFVGLAPVGTFAENPWGLFDVHSNVWEWMWDWYAAELSPKASERGFAGPDEGETRVLRGGSFGSGPGGLRAAVRGGYQPTFRSPDTGFRCVRGGPQQRVHEDRRFELPRPPPSWR